VQRTQRIEAVCARHRVALAAAALQFPLAHPAVASVVTGMRSASEAAQNLAHCAAPIPAAFWDELKHERLIASHAPVGSGL
jgi:D-threo-aldose 1-dehydrogenase